MLLKFKIFWSEIMNLPTFFRCMPLQQESHSFVPWNSMPSLWMFRGASFRYSCSFKKMIWNVNLKPNCAYFFAPFKFWQIPKVRKCEVVFEVNICRNAFQNGTTKWCMLLCKTRQAIKPLNHLLKGPHMKDNNENVTLEWSN